MAEAELVVDDQLTQVPAAIAQANLASMERLDKAVAEIEQQATAFTCLTAADYEAGGAAVTRIRSLDSLYERMFKPLKQWWDAEKKKVLDDEKARRGKLDAAKKLIGDKMLTWKRAEDERIARLKAEEEERARKRAEEDRLAQAEALAAHAKQTGNEQLAAEAVDLLDRPLDIVPVSFGTTVPKVSGGKTVKQKMLVGAGRYEALLKNANGRRLTDADWTAAQVIAGEDLKQLVLDVAASIIVYDTDAPAPVKEFFRNRAKRWVSPEALEANTQWLKSEVKTRGDAFVLGGLTVAEKERLG